MTEEVQRLVTLSLRHPVRLAADAASAAPKELSQEIVRLKGTQVGGCLGWGDAGWLLGTVVLWGAGCRGTEWVLGF